MSNSLDKYETKSKIPQVKFEGKRILSGGRTHQFFEFKWNYYSFLEDLIVDPKIENPLDKVDWSFCPELKELLIQNRYINHS